MEQEILDRLHAQDEILAKIYDSAERTRKYFLFSMMMTLIFFLLPLVGVMFAVPFLLDTVNQATGGLL
jgi:hypothetical protein